MHRVVALALFVCALVGCTDTCPPATEVAPQMTLLVTAVSAVGTDVVVTARLGNLKTGAALVSKSGREVVSMAGAMPGTISFRVSGNDEVWLELAGERGNRVIVRDQKVTMGRPALGVFVVAKDQIWVAGIPSTQEMHFFDGRDRNIDSLVDCDRAEAQWLVDFVTQCSVVRFQQSRVRVVAFLDGHREKSAFAVIPR